MNKEQSKEEIKKLVDYYKELTQKDIESFSEEDTKKDFILPLFHALGWQTNRRDVVVAEEQISKGFVDYSFRINGVTQFYLEAKPLKADLEDVKYARQSINYAWLKNRTWAVLTDFEGLKVFNAQLDIKDPYYATVLDLKFDEFIDKFDKLCLLSPESFLAGDLDKYAEEQHKKKGGVSVSEKLAEDLNDWRDGLTKHFKLENKNLGPEEIDDGVQKILDRLIFIRTCEDRGIENESLLAKYREWEDKGRKGNFQATLKKLFEEYNSIYNSGLFAYHPVVEWETYSDSFEKIIKGLYGTSDDLIYDFKQIDADVLGSVYEQYLGFVQGKKEDKKDSKRKKQGIYYTPTYIVDYIVKNTLGELIREGKDVSDIKVLDPACGSGSFLIKAFEYLIGEVKNEDKTKEYESDKIKAIAKQYQIRNEQKELPKSKKINILRNNIYGVDLDEQAIEIAKLNLLLKATDQKEKLPYLTNLRNGNSLVSGNEKELKEYFGKDWKDKKPFNWNEEFENVMRQGGFDVVIGNPPYGVDFNSQDKKYLQNTYGDIPDFEIYIYFITRGMQLLGDKGVLSYIFPNTFLSNLFGKKYRKWILDNFDIVSIADLSKDNTFAGAQVRTCIFTLRKNKIKNNQTTFYYYNPEKKMFELKNSFNEDFLGQHVDNWLNLFSQSKEEEKVISKLRHGLRISDICDVSQGLIPYDKYRGHDEETIKNRIWHSDTKKDNTYKKELKGGDVGKYSLNWNGKLWISYGKWLAAPRDPKFFTEPRILIREIADESLNCTFTKEEFYNTPSIINIVQKDNNYSLLFLLAILNSKLIGWYYRKTSPKAGKGLFPKILVSDVKNIYIPKVDKKQQKEIIDLADKMLDLNKQLQSIKDDEKSEKIKKEIELINDKIDEKVYDLYGLLKEEIEILEGKDGQSKKL